MESFYVVNPSDYFYNKDFILKYFRKITKLNKSTWDQFKNHLDQLTSEQVIIVGYAVKNDKEYKNQVKKFGIL